jgi:hypothetical protein
MSSGDESARAVVVWSVSLKEVQNTIRAVGSPCGHKASVGFAQRLLRCHNPSSPRPPGIPTIIPSSCRFGPMMLAVAAPDRRLGIRVVRRLECTERAPGEGGPVGSRHLAVAHRGGRNGMNPGRSLLGQALLWRMRNPPTPQCVEEHQGRNAAKDGHPGDVADHGDGYDDDEPESSSDALPTPPPGVVSLGSGRAEGHMSGRPQPLVDSPHHTHLRRIRPRAARMSRVST